MYNGKSSSKFSIIFRVLALVFCVLLLVNFIRFFMVNANFQNLSFTSFLNYLSDVNFTKINVDISKFSIKGSWGAFNFLKDFFNSFGLLFGVVFFLFANLFNLLSFVVGLLGILFV